MQVGFVFEREGECVWYWVRYGRAKLISAGLVSIVVFLRTDDGTDLCVRRILLQVVLAFFATSFLGREHILSVVERVEVEL